MNLEDFQVLDNEPIDNSIIKRDFTKVYHQQGANLNDSNQNIEFIFGENNNYHQIGNSFLQFDINVRNTAGDFTNVSDIRIINIAFVFCFKQATLATTGESDLEDIRYVGQVSTIMRMITSKDSDSSSCFDRTGEKALHNINPLKQVLINKQTVEVNKRKIKAQLPLEHKFGLCKTFEKKNKNLGFHLTFKMNDLQDIIVTTIATDINVTINGLYLYVPIIFPNSETQVLFNESIRNNYTITFNSWYTERKISNDGRELQVAIASAKNNNSPKYLLGVFQINERTTPNKPRNPAVFNTNHVTKYFVKIDGVKYPRDGVLINFDENS